jgi:hypothetical protein
MTGIRIQSRSSTYLFPTTSNMALGSTQLPTQMGAADTFQLRGQSDHIVPRLGMSGVLHLHLGGTQATLHVNYNFE